METAQSTSDLVTLLNEFHSSEVADLVDVFKSQRDYVKVQRLNEAKVSNIDEQGIHIACEYHLWEKEEQNDRFFQHKVKEIIDVFYDWPEHVKPINNFGDVKNAVTRVLKDANDVVSQGFQF